MKKFLTFALVASTFCFLALAPAAQASTCSKLASKAAKETGGEVLSVAAAESGETGACDITIRIPGKEGEPPRVVTRTVSG